MRGEDQPLSNISLDELLANAGKFRMQGCRLVQITCTKIAEGRFELTYSFDKDYKFESVRITVASSAMVPSITGIYRGAFLYENEIRELFGVNFKGINVDYNGHFYKLKVKAPFANDTNDKSETNKEKSDSSCQKE